MIVVGSGAAGMACALALAPLPVLLITKTAGLVGGSSLLSQGGIAAALDPDDRLDWHAGDTVRAGAGLSDQNAVKGLVRDGRDEIRRLVASGFAADTHADGSLRLGLEGAHSYNRIVHAGGDATGETLVALLSAEIVQARSVQVLTRTVVTDLITERGRVAGIEAYSDEFGWMTLRAPAVVLATGGAGALWAETTNAAEATADGLAMAARAGALLADLEFMQFHPTALVAAGQSASRERMPLLTEALRGAGASLVDEAGNCFMKDTHPLGDLAPRDSVARAIWRRRAQGEQVYLDLRPVLSSGSAQDFPQAVSFCVQAGFNPRSEPVPIAPAAHYHMGGIMADEAGRSSLGGLWVCGETASTGVHGANRLASNSLTEVLVWARRVANSIQSAEVQQPLRLSAIGASGPAGMRPARTGVASARSSVQDIMSQKAGIVRCQDGLEEALSDLGDLEQQIELAASSTCDSGAALNFNEVCGHSETRNMVLAARLIVLAALRRQESRGTHFRQDYPQQSAAWAHRQKLSFADLTAEEVNRHASSTC